MVNCDEYVLSQLFVHFEHIDSVHMKDRLHSVVTDDFSLIFGVLKALRFDIVPYMLDDLRAG